MNQKGVRLGIQKICVRSVNKLHRKNAEIYVRQIHRKFLKNVNKMSNNLQFNYFDVKNFVKKEKKLKRKNQQKNKIRKPKMFD